MLGWLIKDGRAQAQGSVEELDKATDATAAAVELTPGDPVADHNPAGNNTVEINKINPSNLVARPHRPPHLESVTSNR